MSFPPSLTTRTVTGGFVTYPDGKPARGTVRIVLNDFMQGPTDDLFVAPFDQTIKLDENGRFSTILPATNDPQWTPSFYKVVISTLKKDPATCNRTLFGPNDFATLTAKLEVGYDSTQPIDLSDALNVPAGISPGQIYIVVSQRGVPGGIATLGDDGKVTPTQLPASSGGAVEWVDILDKPSTFPHDAITWDEIQGKPDLSGGGTITWDAVTEKPTTFPPQSHTHAETDVVGLQTSLDGKSNVGHTHATSDIASLDTALASKATTTALTTGLAGKTDVGHTHAESDISGLTADLAAKATTTDLTSGLAGKANASHTHAQTDITGLSTALSAKADASSVTASLATKADTSSVTASLATKADLVGGVIPTAQLPAIAVIDFLGSVSTQTAMLALIGQKGDWCIRTDLGQTWVITGSDPTLLASWTAMPLANVPVQTVNGQTGTVVLGKADVGLGNVDNTSDVNKPVSTAQQTALNLKAPLASPTFTGTVSGVTAAMVGLGSVDNTSDANKPVSTAQATALALKAPLASPTFTGTVSGVTAAMVGLGNVNNTSDASKPVSTAQQAALDAKAPLTSPTFTGTVGGITATMVGLGNVNNTSDASKPVSTAQQTALDAKAPLASPALTGTPTAPTAASGTSNTQIATTAFVSAFTAKVLVLGPADAVPGGTPAGTVIVRTAT